MVEKIYFDLSKLSEMLDGDKEAIINMIRVFNHSTPELLAQLDDLFEKNDLEKVAKVAHNLKSSVSVFGIHTLIADLDRIVSLGRQNTGKEEISLLIQKTERVLRDTILQLETHQKDLEEKTAER
ncbi:MAG: Hpt domain-containing protein [Bacteroidales bacterium]|nr:Hpt domain-containing protein [Bacteroidales bacterium]